MTRFARLLLSLILLSTVIVALTFAEPAARAATPLDNRFLWGVASAGFQVEGSNRDSNWLRYSKTADDPVGEAVDFYHRYRSDIALAAKMGVRVYRISIEWARVQPQERFDEQGWKFYDDVVAAIVEAGMRPMITLDHWVYPGWVADRGGWNNPAMTTLWLRYARAAVDRYSARNPLWVSINEPSAYVMQEVRHGGLPPTAVPAMVDRLVQVHHQIYRYIHRRQPRAQVTSNAAYIPTLEPGLDAVFADRMVDAMDFVGVDYYYSVSPARPNALGALTGQMWTAPISADGLYYALRYYARRYPGKPIYVVESGMPTDNGAPRADGYRRGDHLADLVYWLQRAVADGIPVIGYNYWSITDNYEWGSYAPRFGLYTVDARTDPTLTRRPTDAVAVYRRIIAQRGVGADYRPSRPAEFCSLVDAPSSCTDPVR